MKPPKPHSQTHIREEPSNHPARTASMPQGGGITQPLINHQRRTWRYACVHAGKPMSAPPPRALRMHGATQMPPAPVRSARKHEAHAHNHTPMPHKTRVDDRCPFTCLPMGYVRTHATPHVRTCAKSAGQTTGAPPSSCRSAAPSRPAAHAAASTFPAKRAPQYKCLGLMRRLVSHTCMTTCGGPGHSTSTCASIYGISRRCTLFALSSPSVKGRTGSLHPG